MVDGVKEFHLIVEVIDWEMAPGMTIKAWGYNGQTPGPTIETVEGANSTLQIRPSYPIIPQGETYVYEFTLKQQEAQSQEMHGC